MSDSNSNLEDIVESYLSTQDIYKQNDYRNSILLSVSSSNGSDFLTILYEIYEKNDDPADRQKVLKLLNEVISRTENVFDFVKVVQFLLKCLKLTICVQLSVNTMKSLLTRHFNNEDLGFYDSLQKFYDLLLSKKISQYPQQCRIDFLYISNFMLDSYLNGKIRRPNVEMMCDAVSGEKDPRNLLIMFDLLAKLASKIAKEPNEFEYISNTYSIYYPIQFVPPKKDKIRITPLQLKKKLLGCFTSNKELAPFSIEILLDSLYSEFSVEEQHISVISDTLYFLKRCKPLYGSQFVNFRKQLIEIIKSELLENDVYEQNSKDMEVDVDNNNKVVDYNTDSVSDILDNLSVKKSNDNQFNKQPDDLLSVYQKMNNTEKKYTNNNRNNITEINKIGKVYYKEWKYVDEKTKLLSEILRLFLESMDDLDSWELERFMKLLKNTIYTNYSIGYMIDVLCENIRLHSSIVDYIVIPLLEDIYKIFVDAKNSENSQQIEGVMNILSMFILPKILVHFKGHNINEQLILVLLKLIDTNNNMIELDVDNKKVEDRYNNYNNIVNQETHKILKLLLLSSCIVDTDLIDKQVKYVINMVFNGNEEIDNNNRDKEVVDYNDKNINNRSEENMYLEILMVIYKCHQERSSEIVNLLDTILNYDFKECRDNLIEKNDDHKLSDFRKYIKHISYVSKDNRVSNISLEIVEMFKISLRYYLMDNNVYIGMSLVRKIMMLSFSCLDYIILSKDLENNNKMKLEVDNIENADHILDLCMTHTNMIAMLYEYEDWSTGSEMLRNIISNDKLLKCYYGLLDYYKRSFYYNEESSFRLIFITSKVPRILSYLARCIGIDLFGSQKLDESIYKNSNRLEFLNLYLYNKGDNNNTDKEVVDYNDRDYNKSEDIFYNILDNKFADDFEIGLGLLNIEAYFMLKNCKNQYNIKDYNKYNKRIDEYVIGNELENMFDFLYFNGSMLVKHVHEMYRFDFKNMIEQIKMFNQYQVNNLEYDDLFFMVIPISFNEVKPILKYQMIDMRKLYKIKNQEKKEKNNKVDMVDNNRDKQFGNNNKESVCNNSNEVYMDNSPMSSTEIVNESTIEFRDKLLRVLFEKLKNGCYDTIPNYYNSNEIKNKKYSKVELYVSFILILLNKGVNCIEIEYIRNVLEELDGMLNAVLYWMENDNNKVEGRYNNNNSKSNEANKDNKDNKIMISEYIRWCCDKYLLYLQTLTLGVLNNINNDKYEINEREEIKDMLTKNLELLIRDLVRIYKGNRVPFCRILTILCIHSIITSKFINIERNMRMKVIKTCSYFLGDPNKKVRGIAVLCRHQWINNIEE